VKQGRRAPLLWLRLARADLDQALVIGMTAPGRPQTMRQCDWMDISQPTVPWLSVSRCRRIRTCSLVI
jgi:hypothetical protein